MVEGNGPHLQQRLLWQSEGSKSQPWVPALLDLRSMKVTQQMSDKYSVHNPKLISASWRAPHSFLVFEENRSAIL